MAAGDVLRRPFTEIVHEGKYAAEVQVELIMTEGDWSPSFSLDDAKKIERVRLALRRGDHVEAAKEAEVYELLPLTG